MSNGTEIEGPSLFGDRLDQLARSRGGWPSGAIVHGVKVVGNGDDPMVLLKGAVPVGLRKDGSPRFERSTKGDVEAGCLISEYRAAIAKATSPGGEQ